MADAAAAVQACSHPCLASEFAMRPLRGQVGNRLSQVRLPAFDSSERVLPVFVLGPDTRPNSIVTRSAGEVLLLLDCIVFRAEDMLFTVE